MRLSAEEPPVLIISKIRRSYGDSPTTSRAMSRHNLVRFPRVLSVMWCDVWERVQYNQFEKRERERDIMWVSVTKTSFRSKKEKVGSSRENAYKSHNYTTQTARLCSAAETHASEVVQSGRWHSERQTRSSLSDRQACRQAFRHACRQEHLKGSCGEGTM